MASPVRSPRVIGLHSRSREEEKQFLIQAAGMVEEVTGQRPIGYNCNWLRRGTYEKAGTHRPATLAMGGLGEAFAKIIKQKTPSQRRFFPQGGKGWPSAIQRLESSESYNSRLLRMERTSRQRQRRRHVRRPIVQHAPGSSSGRLSDLGFLLFR